MSTRSDRDKNKVMQERHQVILSTLLKDEDNKYCVDCDAKGPRWASWNLGIFLCIRCAGIHRNLGVHISKVKSVNLDTWTPEQIASVEDMGNSRARAVYEANIPDGFRRPQTDSALESFIRAKYETKKYIAKEWVPPKPRTQKYDSNPKLVEEKKEKKRPKPKSSVQLSNATVNRPETSKASPPKAEVKAPAATPQTQTASAVDLLGLDTPSVSNNVDPFGDFLAASTTPNPNVNAQQAPAQQQQQPVASAVPQSQPLQNGGATEENLFGESKESQEKSQSTKDSILALYGNAQQPQQQMFGVPGGVYVPQQQQQPGIQQGMYGMPQQQQQQYAMQNGMMANQGMMQQPQVSQGMMQQPQVSQGMMQGQGNMMMANNMQAMQQQNMMQNNMAHQNMMGVGQQQMGQQNMGLQNMGQQQMGGGMMQNNMYNMPQQNQQQNFQQVQNQMASMKLGGGVGGYTQQQPGMVGGPTGASWGGAPQGQTLSTNLWQ
ncbi:unnamed protein product [Owenia fusiformis]|uniref:Arf-GAP domain-containing protein n=1 Tax=Owenia fusiformis TaxID=6347 RepID=A0A8S4N221_OWEFU|nr:unnamed protein product [Owenia fusiformis]